MPATPGSPGTRVQIRSCTPDEWPVIREVRLTSLADAPGAFTSSYERESEFDESTWRDRATTGRWFVASDEGAWVGVAGGIEGRSGDRARRELVGMWVAPAHRHRRIARSLLDHVAGWARTEGAAILDLSVLSGNSAARTAYLRMGLRATGESTPAWNDPSDFVEHLEMPLLV